MTVSFSITFVKHLLACIGAFVQLCHAFLYFFFLRFRKVYIWRFYDIS